MTSSIKVGMRAYACAHIWNCWFVHACVVLWQWEEEREKAGETEAGHSSVLSLSLPPPTRLRLPLIRLWSCQFDKGWKTWLGSQANSFTIRAIYAPTLYSPLIPRLSVSFFFKPISTLSFLLAPYPRCCILPTLPPIFFRLLFSFLFLLSLRLIFLFLSSLFIIVLRFHFRIVFP